jgi:hypothetical protein
MPFVILDTAGKPLAEVDGSLILLASEQEARSFLRPGERVERYSPPPLAAREPS